MEDKKPVHGVQTSPPQVAQEMRGDPGEAEENTRSSDALSDQLANLRQMMEGDILPDVEKFRSAKKDMHYFWASTTSRNDPIYRRLQMGYVMVKPEEFPEIAADFRVSEGQYSGCIGCNEMLLMKIPRVLALELMKINHYERPMAEEGRIQSEAVKREYQDRYGRPLGGFSPDDEGYRDLAKPLKGKVDFSL